MKMKQLVITVLSGFINVTAVLFPKWNAEYLFDLLCKVKRVGISEKGRIFLEKGQTQYLDIDGFSAALHKWGSGDKNLLFLHGWMSNSQRWAPYVEQLDLNEYTVYALDAPGHGMARGNRLNLEVYRKAMVQSIDLIGEVETLVCHSLGSLVGSYGYLHNEKIAINRFIIMGAPSGVDAIFIYFKDLVGLSKKAMQNLEVKINEVLQLPHNEIGIAQFIEKVERPVLVVHERTDRITPFEPIRVASEWASNGSPHPKRNQKQIATFFTEGQDHNLKSTETVDRVLQFINNR